MDWEKFKDLLSRYPSVKEVNVYSPEFSKFRSNDLKIGTGEKKKYNEYCEIPQEEIEYLFSKNLIELIVSHPEPIPYMKEVYCQVHLCDIGDTNYSAIVEKASVKNAHKAIESQSGNDSSSRNKPGQ